MLNTAADIATMVGGEIVGDDRREVREFSRIQESSKGALSFVANPKYEQYLENTQASVVLVQSDLPLPDRTDITTSKLPILIKLCNQSSVIYLMGYNYVKGLSLLLCT